MIKAKFYCENARDGEHFIIVDCYRIISFCGFYSVWKIGEDTEVKYSRKNHILLELWEV